MSLRAGDLRDAVTVEYPIEQTNAYGESTMTWGVFAHRRASVENVSVQELMSAQGPYTVATHNVRFRYLPGLKAEMRLVRTNRTPNEVFDIISIASRNNREEHFLVCKEQVS